LNILVEREARYAGNAPLDLLNQIADHRMAIDLTNQVIAGDLSNVEWQEALKPLLLAVNHGQVINVGNIEVGGDVDGNIVVGHGNIIQRITYFFQGDTKGQTEQRNRRVMLDHVENFWVKDVLERSLHREALRAHDIEENPGTLRYPWAIQRGPRNETIPAGKSMLDIFQEIGLGRSLLILGKPGAGKTIMLLELARQMIQRARSDPNEPFPMIFNLSTWKEGQALTSWLVQQLNLEYEVPRKIAHTWVAENRMSLLLDGLDEVGGDNRDKCVEAINDFRKQRGLTSLVVCSRIDEYSRLKTKLSLKGEITIQPLSFEQINDYVDRFGNSLASLRQWLREDSDLKKLAETPLLLSIMALAYKDVNPDQLLVSNEAGEKKKHLFNTYVTRMFERSSQRVNSGFTRQEAIGYLSWLAGIMIRNGIMIYQIESMQPSWLEAGTQQRSYKWVSGLLFGLIFGLLFGLIFGLGGELLGALLGGLFGLLFGLAFGPDNKIEMVDRMRWSWKNARDNLRDTLIGGLFGGLVVGLIVGLIDGLSQGLLYGLLTLLAAVPFSGLSSEQIGETHYPGQRLKQTLYIAISIILIFGLLFGLIGVLLFGGFLFGGLGIGLIVGLTIGIIFAGQTLIKHYTLRYFLMKGGVLPGRLIAFLDHAVDLIFLRRVGGSYIFVHRLLMEHFAEMEV
jgi:hypothetical protein